MRLFQDIFTGKEILTDSYKMKLVDDFVYEVDTPYVTKSGDQISDDMIGGNPSAEDQCEALDEPSSVSGFDVVLNHEELQEYSEELPRKEFLKILKKVFRSAKDVIPEERFEKVFKPKMNEFFMGSGKGKTRFDNFRFYFSYKYDADQEVMGAPILLDADDSGMKATMYYFKDLMVEIKL